MQDITLKRNNESIIIVFNCTTQIEIKFLLIGIYEKR